MYNYCISISEDYRLVGVSAPWVKCQHSERESRKTLLTQQSFMVTPHSSRASSALGCNGFCLVVIWARVGFDIATGVEKEYGWIKGSSLVRQIKFSPL